MSAIKLIIEKLMRVTLLMRLGKSSLTPLILILVMAFTSADVAHAFPVNQCAADRFGSDLVCSANDVSITGMSVVGDTTSCVGGTSVTLDLQMTVNFATPDRWDIGIFISGDGKDPQIMAANGGAASCSVSVLPNSSPFLNLDGGATGDICGDGNDTIGGGTGSGIHFMPNVTVPCQSLGGAGGNLYIPFVVSWDNQKTSPGAVCTSNADPVPNTKSKCNAPTIVQGSVAVVVLPTLSKTDGKSTLFSGDSTSYAVTITNTTGAALSGAVFKDPAVSGITVNSLVCSASGGASCPASSTVAAMQGAGITIPDMPAGGSVTFTIGATLTGNPGDSRINTATVTVGSQSNSASDTNIIVDSIAILPTTQSKNADNGGTATYTYTLYNFGSSTDVITLSAVSSRGWEKSLSPTSVSVAAGGSTTVTLTMTIPGGAAIGDVDTTTITAISGNNPGKQATATAITTVTTVLTLIPSNTGAGGAGSSVYYTHRVQNNASTTKSVSLTPVLSGTCTGWSSALFESNNTTPLTSPVTLTANGGYKDFVLKISIPTGAAASSTCTATLTAAYTSGTASAVSVTDVTTVKNLVLYNDPGYTTESYVYPAGNNVYAKGYGLASGTNYEYRWYNAAGTEVCLPRATSTTGTIFPDTCPIPVDGPLGTWVVQIWNKTTNSLFVQSNFYVGPDHLKASYSGASPATNTDTIINLALHDRYNHVVPKDSSGNLVIGNPPTTGDPLMVTVTVSGSAQIVSTTLTNAVIIGQAVTGKLDSVTGTATLTIRDSFGESVTITPLSYKGVLYGSPVRDEPVTVVFRGMHHLEMQHGSGTGLTCAASTLTIRACADAGCATPYTGGVVGTLTATGTPAVSWDGTTGGAAGSGFVIASGSSTVTKSFQLATAGSVVLGIASPAPVPANAVTCNFGSPMCTFTTDIAGFIFSDSSTGGGYNIPAQVSGIATPTLYLRALQASTTNPAVCTPAIVGSTTSVDMGYACNNPTSCQAGSLATITNTTTGTATAIAPGGTSVSLNFDANGSAPMTARYDDVGLITLNASKTVTPFGGATPVTLNGNSNSYVVAPHHFGFSAISAGPIKAGNNFSATVTAYNGLATPTAAANFGKELAAESAMISFTKCQPTGVNAVNGSFSGSVGSFSSGSASASNLNWSEVGNGDLVATLASASYLGSGLSASGNSGTSGTVCNGGGAGNVGAFIPDHFITTVTDGCAGCGFTYSGQPFTVFVTAKNGLAVPGTTLNYDGTTNTSPNFANDVSLTDANAASPTPVGKFGVSATPMGVTVNLAGDTLTVPKADFVSGVATLTLVPTYTFNVSPTVPTTVKIRAIDAVNTSLTSSGFTEGTTEIRSGRIKISNAYGSELLPLPMKATVQFYNATGSWASSSSDTVTTIAAANFALSFPVATLVACETALTVTGNSPNFKLNLSAPGGGNNGWTDLMLNLGAVASGNRCTAVGAAGPAATTANRPWLQYPAGTNPTARATFGVYKGSNDFIYQREAY